MDPFSAENPPVCNQEIEQYFYTMNIRSSHKFARNFFNGRMEGVQKLYGGGMFFWYQAWGQNFAFRAKKNPVHIGTTFWQSRCVHGQFALSYTHLLYETYAW